MPHILSQRIRTLIMYQWATSTGLGVHQKFYSKGPLQRQLSKLNMTHFSRLLAAGVKLTPLAEKANTQPLNHNHCCCPDYSPKVKKLIGLSTWQWLKPQVFFHLEESSPPSLKLQSGRHRLLFSRHLLLPGFCIPGKLLRPKIGKKSVKKMARLFRVIFSVQFSVPKKD